MPPPPAWVYCISCRHAELDWSDRRIGSRQVRRYHAGVSFSFQRMSRFARKYDQVARFFIYEHASALGPQAPLSLRLEGRAMLAAVVEDVRHMGGHVTTMLHPDCESLGHECLRPTDSSGAEAAFRTEARRADFTLVIAPETGGVLTERCRWALAAGGRLLGSGPEAIDLCADKLALG